jgi:hypothetical protein
MPVNSTRLRARRWSRECQCAGWQGLLCELARLRLIPELPVLPGLPRQSPLRSTKAGGALTWRISTASD